MLRFPVLIAGLASLSALSAGGQDKAAPDKPQPPVFSARTELVLVDFVVTDKSDQTVAGLSAKDFVIKEDGKERPVVSFVAFSSGVVQPPVGGPVEVVVEAGPAPVAPRSTAVTVVFVDDGQMSPSQAVRLRPSLKKLVDAIAEQSGAMILLAPWSQISLAKEVEGNRALFGAAVDKINGRRVEEHGSFPISDAEAIAIDRGDPTMLQRIVLRFLALNPNTGFDPQMAEGMARSRATEVAHDARVRMEDVYGVLLKSLDWLARQPGRHSLVMVSGGYAWDPDDTRQREVVTRSLRANAPIHFLDARGLEGFGTFQGVEYGPALDRDAGETPFAFADAAQGSYNLALDTGGLAIRNTNDMTRGLKRVLDMTTTYYVIGYEPPEHKKRGFRKIKVEVQNKGLKVIARRGYFDEASAPH